MGTRSVMWIVVGVILLVGGLLTSLRDGQRPSGNARTAESKPRVVERLSDQRPAERAGTGLGIDPVRDPKQKDRNADYFR